MQRTSAPKHRHDGTSPLPLGMDWSPPPRLWAGRETVWPHDPRTGWSYCVTIPSWVVLAKSRESDPTVFYRVQIGVQSPEGITTTRTVLRRFNDFMKLHSALKRTFPQNDIPPAPPKGLLQMKTRTMLEARRMALEEWMTKLLSVIDLSRSMVVASFLELEAAARASFQDESQQSSDPHVSVNMVDSSHHVNPNASLSVLAGSSFIASDYGSDTAYETSEIGSPSLGRDNYSEAGMEDLYDGVTSPIEKFVKYGISNIDEGLSMGQAILEKLESFPKHNVRELHSNLDQNMSNGSSSKASHCTDNTLEHASEPVRGTLIHHVRKLSNESMGSDRSSLRGGELSNMSFPNSNGHGMFDFRSVADVSTAGTIGDLDYKLPDDMQLLFPIDQRQKMNRVLMTLQRRLFTAKTDMEDLISRLNQEIAVKDYLATKVKDLEVELETTKQKSKENLEQAILIERERVTQMQWDMEELRQKLMEMKLKLNSQEAQRQNTQPDNSVSNGLKDALHEDLDSEKKQFEDLLKRYQELEVKSKTDIKVLVKEVKSLRSSQTELKKQLNMSLEEKSKVEELLEEERERNERRRSSWRNLLSKCKVVHDQLRDCNINNSISSGVDDHLQSTPSLDVDEIDLLIAEVEHIAEDVNVCGSAIEWDDEWAAIDEELRQLVISILVDNGILRKEMKSVSVDACNLVEKG